jgi:hypothetical protein
MTSFVDDAFTIGQVRLAVVLDYAPGREAAGIAYEDAVLPLLSDHGGRVEQRLRSEDGGSEVQLIAFSSRAEYEAYLEDPRRAALRSRAGDAVPATRVIEVRPTSG